MIYALATLYFSYNQTTIIMAVSIMNNLIKKYKIEIYER